MTGSWTTPAHQRALGIRQLWLGRVAGEVSAALRRAGVRALLLKGPALQRLLYRDGVRRPYQDVDLLISPSALPAAERTLRLAGFTRQAADEDFPGHDPLHGLHWRRDALSALDLHTTLPGAEGEREAVWRALASRTGPIEIDGVALEALGDEANALHVALHAAHHGRAAELPMEDLRRAVEQLPEPTWGAAADLAAEISAESALASGLRLTPRGSDLADRLGLPAGRSLELELKARSAPPLAEALLRLRSARGTRRKLAVIARALVPSRDWVRWWSPLARQGRLGLALSYLWLPLWIVLHLPGALLALVRARRAASGGPSRP